MSTAQFLRDWHKETDAVRQRVSTAVKDTALYGWNLVTAKTPVRTGRARSSWMVSVDFINNATLSPVSPYPRNKGEGRVYGNPEIPKINYNIDKDKSIFISNNVEYIEYLETGTDRMQAFAMVSSSVPAINRKLKQELRKVK